MKITRKPRFPHSRRVRGGGCGGSISFIGTADARSWDESNAAETSAHVSNVAAAGISRAIWVMRKARASRAKRVDTATKGATPTVPADADGPGRLPGLGVDEQKHETDQQQRQDSRKKAERPRKR